MKYITTLLIVTTFLAFASCAQRNATTEASRTTTSTGYSK